MQEIELVLGLLVAVAVMATLARPLGVPYPILLVLGGLVLALVPAVPDVELAPDLVFLLFLPPLLYSAGFENSIRDVRTHLQHILSLPELSWPMAFTLGAIVSPPDAVAAVAIFRGLGVPRSMVTLLEGESLFNDATALVTALALPLTIPGRDLLLFLTFCVILVTLVGQGLSLPWLIRALGVAAEPGQRAELHARAVATEAAVARLEELADEWPTHRPLIETLRTHYTHRLGHPGEHGPVPDHAATKELLEHQGIRHAVIEAERAAVLELRDRGELNDEVSRRIERDLDLDEVRMEA